jgi:ABC-type transport system involved in multi-copper enzyme maturation permease subunit
MTEMVRRFLRQKLGSVGVVIALSVLSLLTAVQVMVAGGGHALESGGFVALLILAAASVSKDSSSGALQMILARPIRRVEYLFGRYCGILLGYAIYIAVTAAVALALSPLLGTVLGRGSASALAFEDVGRGAAGALLSAALLAAVLLFFSTFLRGYGDILAYFLLSLLLGAPDVLAGALRKPWLLKVGAVVRENVLPHVEWEDVLRGKDVFSAATGQYVLALTAYLALAAWVFSQREFSYGQD